VLFGEAVRPFVEGFLGIFAGFGAPEAVGFAGSNPETGLAGFVIGEVGGTAADGSDAGDAGTEVEEAGFEPEGGVPNVGMEDGFCGAGS
jgi:hypothetical protein